MPTRAGRLLEGVEIEAESGGDDLGRAAPASSIGAPGSASGRRGPTTRVGGDAAAHEQLEAERATERAAQGGAELEDGVAGQKLADCGGSGGAELLAAPPGQRRHERRLRQRQQPADLERRRVADVLAAVRGEGP